MLHSKIKNLKIFIIHSCRISMKVWKNNDSKNLKIENIIILYKLYFKISVI